MSFRGLHTGFLQRSICVVLAISMVVGPALEVWAQNSSAKPPASPASQPAPAAPAAPIDTTYIAPGATALVVLRPAQLMKSPIGEFLPTEVATAAGLKYLGLDPANVEEATAFVDTSNPAMPNYGVAIKFVEPLKGFNPPPELRAHAKLDELAGKKYLKSQHPLLPSFYAPNNHTLLVAPDATIKQFVEGPVKVKTGPLFDRIKNTPGGNDLYVLVDIASLRPLIQMALAQAQRNMPPEAQQFVNAINLISAAELTVNLSKPAPSSLVVHANDAAAAKQIETLISDTAAKGREQMRAQLARLEMSDDPVQRAYAHYLERMSERWSQPFMPSREGADLTFFRFDGSSSPQQQLVAVAVIGMLVALLLPAVQGAREAARRNQSMSNMKQLLLALLMYEDNHKAFPAHAVYSKDGKPLLSWRVAVLPYIDQQDLYGQFHLDEPWDSEHNRALIAKMPAVFQNPNQSLPSGKTNYLAVVGKECVFDGSSKGLGIQQITDGTSKTIMVVEANANQAVDWTKPDDLKYDTKNPTAGLGRVRPGGWLAAFADGHIQFISSSIDINTLKALFTRAGGEVINSF
ncbi:MAG TPA: DUF1559 domain-containing protein [Lacipirellulaceae bacterium]|nr:DUF1559 domain-containing protein [Lacipirellulaceae bacterium]